MKRGDLTAAVLLAVTILVTLQGSARAQYQMDPDAGYLSSGVQYDPDATYQLEGVRIYDILGDETQKLIGFMKVVWEDPGTGEVSFLTFQEVESFPDQALTSYMELAVIVPSAQAYPGSPYLSAYPTNEQYQMAADQPWGGMSEVPPCYPCPNCVRGPDGKCHCSVGKIKDCYR